MIRTGSFAAVPSENSRDEDESGGDKEKAGGRSCQYIGCDNCIYIGKSNCRGRNYVYICGGVRLYTGRDCCQRKSGRCAGKAAPQPQKQGTVQEYTGTEKERAAFPRCPGTVGRLAADTVCGRHCGRYFSAPLQYFYYHDAGARGIAQDSHQRTAGIFSGGSGGIAEGGIRYPAAVFSAGLRAFIWGHAGKLW